MTDIEPVLTLTKDGRTESYRTKRTGERKSVRVGREWSVHIDGVLIGHIRYEMLTREQKTPGRTYVNSRWHSPGWQYRSTGLSWFEPVPSTRKAAVERLVRIWTLDRQRATSSAAG